MKQAGQSWGECQYDTYLQEWVGKFKQREDGGIGLQATDLL